MSLLLKDKQFLLFIDHLKKRFAELGKSLSEIKDFSSKEYLDLSQSYKRIEKILECQNELVKKQKQKKDIEDALKGESEKEFIEYYQEEIKNIEESFLEIEKTIFFSISKKKDSPKKFMLEIRPGIGGDEAALFANELYRMYLKYAEKKSWKTEVISFQSNEKLTCKEAIIAIQGDNAYEHLQYEIGGHRVQRIPITESSGRIHTSLVTVAALPEAEESDIDIKPNELKIDVYRSSGPGGQSVNTTDSAVRITHLPTKMVVQCQDEKSQHKNKAKAMRILRARLLAQIKKNKNSEISLLRKNQLGSGDRSDRIRTYNFTQNRLTDHRINISIYNKLDAILAGDLDIIIDNIIKSKTLDVDYEI